MPIAFVHVGTGKTGTTSIQMALHANAGLLRDRGFHIVRTGQWRPDSIKQRLVWSDPDDPSWAALTAELAQARAQGQHVILSNETMWQLGEADRQRLARLLAGFTPRVLIYLREQADFAQAMLLQRAKSGKGDIDLGDERRIERWMSRRPLDYQAVCQGFEDALGPGTVRARAFRDDALVHGDLLADVLDGLGLPETSGLALPQQGANPSVSAEFAIALTDLARELPEERFLVVKDLACRLTANGLGQRHFMGRAQVERIRSQYQAANDRLAAGALAGRLPLTMKPAWRQLPLGDAAEYRAMLLSHEARIVTLPWSGPTTLDARWFTEGWLVDGTAGGAQPVARLAATVARMDLRMHFRWRHRHRDGVVEWRLVPQDNRSMPVRVQVNGVDLGPHDLATQTLRIPLALTEPLDEVHLVLHSDVDPALQPPIVRVELPVAAPEGAEDDDAG